MSSGQVAFYKFLTWTGLENSSVGTKKIIWSFGYFSMLYDEASMVFLLPDLS